MIVSRKTLAKNLQQDLAASIERAKAKIALPRHQLQRRIDKTDIPATITSRILIAAGKDGAAVSIELLE